MKNLDDAVIEWIKERNLIRYNTEDNLKVALIGEWTSYQKKKIGESLKKKDTLVYKLKKNFGLKHVTVFTDSKRFEVDDGKRFDLFIAVCPCFGECIILDSATKYNKKFIIVLCRCGFYIDNVVDDEHRLSSYEKVVYFLKKYPTINYLDAHVIKDDSGLYTNRSWIFLYNN